MLRHASVFAAAVVALRNQRCAAIRRQPPDAIAAANTLACRSMVRGGSEGRVFVSDQATLPSRIEVSAQVRDVVRRARKTAVIAPQSLVCTPGASLIVAMMMCFLYVA